MAQSALHVIRPLVKASSHLFPRAAGRMAFRLFCTPLGRVRPDRGSPRFKAAEALFSRAEPQIVTYGRGYLRSFTFEPEGNARGSVLVLHGWAGEAMTMAGVIETLLAQGFRVIAPDLPAHGGSSGRHLTLPLAMEALNVLMRREAPLAGVLGHSFGGMIGMVAIAGAIAPFAPLRVRRFVSIAAPSNVQVYGRKFTRLLGLTPAAHQAFEARVQALAGRPMESFSGQAFLRAAAVPALIIHARDDKEIPLADAEDLAAAGGHVTLMAVDGHGHRRILGAREIQKAAAEFLAQPGPDRPDEAPA